MIHPFHPWVGREFVFVALRHTWGEARVFFFDVDGVQTSLPAGWTDVGPVDVFVKVAGGRSPFRVEDLVRLGRLIDVLRAGGAGDL